MKGSNPPGIVHHIVKVPFDGCSFVGKALSDVLICSCELFLFFINFLLIAMLDSTDCISPISIAPFRSVIHFFKSLQAWQSNVIIIAILALGARKIVNLCSIFTVPPLAKQKMC